MRSDRGLKRGRTDARTRECLPVGAG